MELDNILLQEQQDIHKNLEIKWKDKLPLILNLFNKRLSNANGDLTLTKHIQERKASYLFAIYPYIQPSFSPKPKGYKIPKKEKKSKVFVPKHFAQIDIDAETRRLRLLRRMGIKKNQELSLADQPLVNSIFDNRISSLIDLGRQSFLGKVYLNTNLVRDLVIIYLLKRNGKCIFYQDINIDIRNYKSITTSLVNKEGKNYYKVDAMSQDDILNFQRNLRACRRNESEALIIHLSLALEDGTSHSNLLIYRTYTNTLERFEPHGSFTSVGEGSMENMMTDNATFNLYLNQELERITSVIFEPISPGIRFISSDLTCPLFGPQTLQLDDVGYCSIWSLIMLEFIIEFPEMSTSEITDGITKSVVKYVSQHGGIVARNMTRLVKGYLLTIETYMNEILKELGINLTFAYPRVDDPAATLYAQMGGTGDAGNVGLFKTAENLQRVKAYLLPH